ncbi:hypothetical protein SAMN05421827_105121 [Pedobacter terrae]|uniref:Uncharacterized protein n=1 Tax=Pedobacter terrae TaxID=405671 RepID=A0A1G7T9C0_9SPHI|nr:hypothetical protein [Pedobacter terrae]SDG31913.1 hypothetical protein SAMN05421827_105121 [Pedobacter terrae]
MKRNELTTAGALAIGDTFYKASDKTKKVFERITGEAKVTDFATYNVTARKHGSKFPEAMKSNTAVVFLRHIG